MKISQSVYKEITERKAPETPFSDSSTTMDEKIWKELSNDLLKGVIARLPIAEFFRLRLVSREWNSLLKSHSFLKRCEEEVVLPQNKPWLYSIAYDLETVRTISMYDPCTEMWRYYSACTSNIYPVASIGGLVCCINLSKNCFMVGNPITQTWKEFSDWPPPGYVDWNTFLGMVINDPSSPSKGYKIIKVDFRGYVVYDSLTNNGTSCLSPTTTGTIPANISLKNSSSTHFPWLNRSVTINSVVYFLILNPSGILSFDAVSGAWEVFHIPAPPNSTDLALGECGGRMLLMGLVRDDNDGTICVCVWELQWTMLEWTEVDRMPKSWCSGFRCKKAYLRCVGNKGLLMMALQKPRTDRIFMYDVVNQVWSEVPRFIVYGRRWLLYTDFGIAFLPSLSAAP